MNIFKYLRSQLKAISFSKNYKSYKKELENYSMKLTLKEGLALKEKMNKFVDSLNPAETVYLAGYDLNRTFGELAYYQLMNRDKDFRKKYERKHIEAMGAYFVEAYSPADVKKKFILTTYEWKQLLEGFTKHCMNVLEETDDKVQGK